MSEVNVSTVDAMTPAQLLEFYNQHSGKAPIKKFKDKATAIKQCQALAEKVANGANGADASNSEEPPIPMLKKDADMAKKARESGAAGGKARKTLSAEESAPKEGAKKASKKAAAKSGAKKASKKAAASENGAKRRGAPSGPRGPRELPKEGSIIERFGAREGTVREKLLKALSGKNLNKNIDRDKLAMAVYGQATKEQYGPLMMTLKGAEKTIKDHNLPFKIVKGERGSSYGLYDA